jgi:hypothetical protein
MSRIPRSISGRHQLKVGYIVKRLGSMAASTKCCGTGTCINYYNPETAAPLIAHIQDVINPLDLAKKYGIIA